MKRFPQAISRLQPEAAGKKAFTVLELFVSLAIVALLAALVIGGVGKARDNGTSMACISKLRQMAAAYMMYVQDHNGRTPPVTVNKGDEDSENHNFMGISLLRVYYGDTQIWSGSNQLRERMEICPSVSINKLTMKPGVGPDYGFAEKMSGQMLNYFTKPSKTPMIWDDWTGNWVKGRTMPLRHNGVNADFLDGHVENIRSADGRLYSDWWSAAVSQSEPDDAKLGQGTPLGSTQIPAN